MTVDVDVVTTRLALITELLDDLDSIGSVDAPACDGTDCCGTPSSAS